MVRTGVDRRTYDSVHLGGPIPVRYLPGDPRQQCLDYPWELSDLKNAPLDDFVVAMMAFVPGVALIGYFGWRNRIHARLMVSGKRTWGEVTEMKKTHTRYGSHSYLVFTFQPPKGPKIQGRTPALPENSHWQVGDPIEVMYDARKPKLFTIEMRHPLDGLIEDEPVPPTHETIWA